MLGYLAPRKLESKDYMQSKRFRWIVGSSSKDSIDGTLAPALSSFLKMPQISRPAAWYAGYSSHLSSLYLQSLNYI